MAANLPQEFLDDTVITTNVKAVILGEPGLKVSEINVETFKGVVQLSGFVNSREDINKAMRVARAVKGVTSVENDMQIGEKQTKLGSADLYVATPRLAIYSANEVKCDGSLHDATGSNSMVGQMVWAQESEMAARRQLL